MPSFNRREFIGTVAAASLTTGAAQSAESAPGSDLVLWYRQPAEKWTDALPIGNGRLGAMVFGGVEENGCS